MENAGAGAAKVVQGLSYDDEADVVIACGPGNNGGDGLVVARHLSVAGFRARVVFLPLRDGEPSSPDARIQLGICRAMGLRVRVLEREDSPADVEHAVGGAGLLVDALFGTGLDRAPEGVAGRVVDALNGASAAVVALDLPTGLDCDTGRPLGRCVRAAHTVTFVAPKLGFAAPEAAPYLGQVHVVGIGAPLDWPPGASPTPADL